MTLRWGARRPSGRRRVRGVSIFEVLIAFIVIQAGMLIALQAILSGKSFGIAARKATYATLVAQAQMEDVVRTVVPTLDHAALLGQDPFVIPDVLSPVPPPASIGALEISELTWQAIVAAADAPGLFDVVVTVHFTGYFGRERSVSLATRAYIPAGAAS